MIVGYRLGHRAWPPLLVCTLAFWSAARAARLSAQPHEEPGAAWQPATHEDQPVAARVRYRLDFQKTGLRSEPPPPEGPAAAAPELEAPVSATPEATGSASAYHALGITRSAAQRKRESADAVKVIDTREAQRHTADMGEVLARSEGIAIQRSGGLGSETRLSLHGLTDDQIRVFMDGLPLSLSGFGLGVSLVPLHWTDRVEVYRGVVPVRYGADALGGAIDLVTDDPRGVGVAASYTAGAFDTHRLGLSSHAFDAASGALLRVAFFRDSTDNDYLVDVQVPDERGRQSPARVRRFHDGYLATGVMAESGVVDRVWADELRLRVYATDFRKELQHNVDMSVPYGEVEYGELSSGASLRYRDSSLGGGPLGLAVVSAYGRRNISFQDTSRWVYDWYGRRTFEKRPGTGELSAFASDQTQWEHHVFSRVSLDLRLAQGHNLRLVSTPEYVTRTGLETLRVNPDRIDPLTRRRTIFRLVNGLEYAASDARDVLDNSAFFKHYLYLPNAIQVRMFDNTIRRYDDLFTRFGAGDALRVRLSRQLLAKASYEYAMRLPRPDEVFGDGALQSANPALTPESSHNGNLGLQLLTRLPANTGQLFMEATGFVRQTRDMIVRLLAQDRVHTIHQNVFDVRTVGVDLIVRWASAKRYLTLEANGTFQEQRNDSARGPFTPFSGQRVPNRPWLFANTSAVLRWPDLGAENAELSLRVDQHYAHGFWPGWEDTSRPDVDRYVPDQLVWNAGLTYSVKGDVALDFTLDLLNLSDARVFDVLGVQRPGRAAFFKVTARWDHVPNHKL